MDTNILYYGDNLEILRHRNEHGDHDYFPANSIDLVYLDPPFNSQQSYNVLFTETDTSWSPAQIKAFEDTWHWGTDTEALYRELLVQSPQKVAKLLDALVGDPENPGGIGRNDVTAYMVMMTARLIELHRVLKPTGSLYLHCDPTASHYLKLMLDQIFSPTNFRNEIIWKRTTAHNDPKRFGRIHDTLLFYSKSDTPTWNTVFAPYDPEYIKTYYRYVDETGRNFLSRDLTAPSHGFDSGQYEWRGKFPPKGRMWAYTKDNMERLEVEGRIFYTKNGYPRLKQYLEDMPGMPSQSIWTDVLNIRSWHKEDLGYDTQKPMALLERIIKASSNECDIVLDPFCGCGTALVAAQKLNRKWIGIDITHLAIAVMKRRLKDHFSGIQIRVIGEPVDLPSAKELAKQDRYQFQWWALSLIGARPLGEKKKGADKGIDGVIPFTDDSGTRLKRVVVQVKSGHVGVKDIRELKTVTGSDPMGLLLTLNLPTQTMKTEAVEAGFYESPVWQRQFPRIQILTIEEALAGKQPVMPMSAPYPKAESIPQGEQAKLV